MQAYILGQNDEKYSQIVASISAIMFLATPHRGSDLAEVLNRILTVSVFNSSKVYVQELGKGSLTIRQLNEQFQHIAPNLDIISFYETLPTTVGPKKIVRYFSSFHQTSYFSDGRGAKLGYAWPLG
jgi:hypothetical protein